MEFLLEALLEGLLQFIAELIIAALDFALESLLGHRVAEEVRVFVSSCFYLFLGAVGGWISVLLLPKPMGGSILPFAYFFFLPLVTAVALFFLMKSSERLRDRQSVRVLAWYCALVSWSFSVARYYFLLAR